MIAEKRGELPIEQNPRMKSRQNLWTCLRFNEIRDKMETRMELRHLARCTHRKWMERFKVIDDVCAFCVPNASRPALSPPAFNRNCPGSRIFIEIASIFIHLFHFCFLQKSVCFILVSVIENYFICHLKEYRQVL